MATGRVSPYAVRLLKERVANIMKQGKDGSVEKGRAEKMRDIAEHVKAIFAELKWCEETILKDLELLEEVLKKSSAEYDQDKLTQMKEKIERMRTCFDELKSPDVLQGRQPSLSDQQSFVSYDIPITGDDDPKTSKYWSDYDIEPEILTQPIITRIQQSYDLFLSPSAKLCALFLAIFPELKVIKKKTLIYWWIGEGLITKSSDMTLAWVREGLVTKSSEKTADGFREGSVTKPSEMTADEVGEKTADGVREGSVTKPSEMTADKVGEKTADGVREGSVTKPSEMTADEVGECVFHELIEKGMVEPHRRVEGSPLIDGCSVSPWVRRMLISLAREAKLFEINEVGEITNDYSESRRLIKYKKRTTSSSKQNHPEGSEKKKNHPEGSEKKKNHPEGYLSTVYNVSERLINFEEDYFSRVAKIDVLQLGRWQNNPHHHIELEKEKSEAEEDKFLEKALTKQLKYLSLRGISRIFRLPDSILQSKDTLEILDLKACHNLERLPSDFGSFQKLTHLDISECYLLESLPKGLEKLANTLQVLKGFTINHWRKNPCKLEALSKFKKLRKLSAVIGVESKQEEDVRSKEGEHVGALKKDEPKSNQEEDVRSKEGEHVGALKKDEQKSNQEEDVRSKEDEHAEALKKEEPKSNQEEDVRSKEGEHVRVPKKDEPKSNQKEDVSSYVREQVGKIAAANGFSKTTMIENLVILTLTWQMKSPTTTSGNNDEINQYFSRVSLPRLEKLDLRCYPGKILPAWVSPKNLPGLKKLYIKGGKLETMVKFLASERWNKVKILRLNYIKHFQFRCREGPLELKEGPLELFPGLEYFENTDAKMDPIEGKYVRKQFVWRKQQGQDVLDKYFAEFQQKSNGRT